MDFGCFTDLVREKLKGCDAIVIESNHSRDMLRTCPVYTWDLKQRIASKTGHLSNEDLADWLTGEEEFGEMIGLIGAPWATATSPATPAISFSPTFPNVPTNHTSPA